MCMYCTCTAVSKALTQKSSTYNLHGRNKQNYVYLSLATVLHVIDFLVQIYKLLYLHDSEILVGGGSPNNGCASCVAAASSGASVGKGCDARIPCVPLSCIRTPLPVITLVSHSSGE